jgi:bifunctional DNA-binding transcriptional regulator/antitoxin component of YhaV-PrlF toxin-antitoxin module
MTEERDAHRDADERGADQGPEALGVRPGDRIGFEVREDGTIVVHAERAERVDLLSLRGVLKPQVRGVTVEQMNETIRKVAGGA